MRDKTIVLWGIYLLVLTLVGARPRVLADFDTDQDLDAWHKFGLGSFYGPWSIVARKPNGDFVSYADYGARIPSDFRPISSGTTTIDDDGDNEDEEYSSSSPVTISHSEGSLEQELSSKYATGISDVAIHEVPLPSYDTRLLHRLPYVDDNREKQRDASSFPRENDSSSENLELIGIVGVVGDSDDSLEEDTSTADFATVKTTTIENHDDLPNVVTDRTDNVSTS